MIKGMVFSLILVVTALSFVPAFARDPGTPAEPETTSAKSLFSFKTDDREPIFGDRFTLKAGYKVWVAKWQAQVSTGGLSNQANSDHWTALSGPSATGIVKLQEGDWFNSVLVNFTWLNGGFDFAEQTENSNHFFANRRDYTITAALPIYQGFGVFGGYYNSRQEITNAPNNPALGVDRHPRQMDGAIVGVFGNVPASERVSVYGNFALAFLSFNGRGNTDPNLVQKTDAVQGYMTEMGVNIMGPRAWKIGTEFQLGFRAQIVQKNFGPNATGGADQQPLNDLTYGPIMTINAVF